MSVNRWENRITGSGEATPEDLLANPENWRIHPQFQQDALSDVLDRVGWVQNVIINTTTGHLIDGHLRVKLAMQREEKTIPVVYVELSEEEERLILTTIDPLSALAATDQDMIDSLINDIGDVEGEALNKLLAELASDAEPEDQAGKDDMPGEEIETISKPGDVWVMGNHRVMCGDSTIKTHVKKLMNGQVADLVHADPPYGMGKEADGVENDNLYRDKLDAFQMKWIKAAMAHAAENCGLYIWGNALELWSLWYRGGLFELYEAKNGNRDQCFDIRNEIVWDKKIAQGQSQEARRMFPTGTERCLFLMRGSQVYGNEHANINTEDYWSEYDQVLGYLEDEAKKAGIDLKTCRTITGTQMFSHWFTRSQWSLIPEDHYLAFREATNGEYFTRPHAELLQLKRDIDARPDNPKNTFMEGRAYFDNTHDNMTDVWSYPIVQGEDREGHATPKPVEMMERVMRSSIPEGGISYEPFGGSGSTLIGAESTGRACYTMELTPKYVDTIVRRWQNFTGLRAILEDDGQTFNDVQADRT